MQYFCIFLLTNYFRAVLSQFFQVGLNYPSLIDNNNTRITKIISGFYGNSIVSLDNSQGRIYNPTFTSYTNFTMKYPADDIVKNYQWVGYPATNFPAVYAIGTISNNKSTACSYNYESLKFIDCYTPNDTINKISVIGFNDLTSFVALYVLYCKNSVLFVYNGSVVNQFSYNPGQANNDNIIQYNVLVSQSADYSIAYFRINSFALQTLNRIYQFQANFNFAFDSALKIYRFQSSSFTMSLIVTMPFQVDHIYFDGNAIIIAQSKTTGQMCGFSFLSNRILQFNGIPNSTIVYFFNDGPFWNPIYYLLQSTGLALINIDTVNSSVTLISILSTLPSQSYDLVLGVTNILYMINQPLIYKVGICIGQSSSNNSVCVFFNCTTPNCSSCPFDSEICGVCNAGYYITSNITCDQLPQIASINTFILLFSESFYRALQALIKSLITLSKALIAVPGARRVLSPLFYYFGVFDDIYFYQFQDREYGETMKSLFSQINEIQTSKWGVVSYTQVLELFHADPTKINDTLDYQNTYLTYNYTTVNHTQLGTQSLLGNCQNFVFVGLPVIIFGFIVGNIVFRLVFAYPISKFFRKFDFFLFIFLLIFDGNAQQFSFYLTHDLRMVFAFHFRQKLIKLGLILFGLVLLLYSTSMFFLSSIIYRRLSYYFSENNKNSVFSLSFLILQYGFKNMVVGSMQSLLRYFEFPIFITILLFTETLFLLAFIVSVGFKIYKLQIKIWLLILLNLAKILLIGTFFVDYFNLNNPLIQFVQHMILFLQIMCFFLCFFSQILIQILYICKFIKKNCFQYNEDIKVVAKQKNQPSFQEYLKYFKNYKNSVIKLQEQEKNQNLIRSPSQNKEFTKLQEIKNNNFFSYSSNIQQNNKKQVFKKSVFSRFRKDSLQ